jgi:hypothetical protein
MAVATALRSAGLRPRHLCPNSRTDRGWISPISPFSGAWGSSLLNWVGAALLRPTQHAASGADEADCFAIIVHYR